MIPIGMGCFPGFFCHVECFHACDLLVITIRKEAADIVEAIAIVGAEEIGGKGLLGVTHLMLFEELVQVVFANEQQVVG